MARPGGTAWGRGAAREHSAARGRGAARGRPGARFVVGDGSALPSFAKDWNAFHIDSEKDPDAAKVTLYGVASQLDISVE